MEEVVEQTINKGKKSRRQNAEEIKQRLETEKIRLLHSRRQALFQEYHDGGEHDAMVYLTQLAQDKRWPEHSVETSGDRRVVLECDGEVREMW